MDELRKINYLKDIKSKDIQKEIFSFLNITKIKYNNL